MAEYSKDQYDARISEGYQKYLKAEGKVGRYMLVSPRFLSKAGLSLLKTAIYPLQNATVGESPLLPQQPYFATDLTLSGEGGVEIKFVDAVCKVLQTNAPVTTSLVGLPGTIKEGVAMGDYTITITAGLIANTEGNWELADYYPQKDVEALARMLNKPDPITVNSAYLALFGVNRIVIKDFTIDQTSDSNWQKVVITALSDEDYTIDYNKY